MDGGWLTFRRAKSYVGDVLFPKTHAFGKVGALFLIVDPLGNIPIFLTLTRGLSLKRQFACAISHELIQIFTEFRLPDLLQVARAIREIQGPHLFGLR